MPNNVEMSWKIVEELKWSPKVMWTPKIKENTCAPRKSNFWRGPQDSQRKMHLLRKGIWIVWVIFLVGFDLEFDWRWVESGLLPLHSHIHLSLLNNELAPLKDCLGLSGEFELHDGALGLASSHLAFGSSLGSPPIFLYNWALGSHFVSFATSYYAWGSSTSMYSCSSFE